MELKKTPFWSFKYFNGHTLEKSLAKGMIETRNNPLSSRTTTLYYPVYIVLFNIYLFV